MKESEYEQTCRVICYIQMHSRELPCDPRPKVDAQPRARQLANIDMRMLYQLRAGAVIEVPSINKGLG